MIRKQFSCEWRTMKKKAARRRIDVAEHGPRRPAMIDGPLRDRIKELRRVRAAELLPHPLNWRLHPPEQRAVLEALLREVGFANALLVRELPDGRLQLIDGHLRAETAPEMEVPVLVLDVDESEAEKLLATLDPVAALAAADARAIAALREKITSQETVVAEFLDAIRGEAEASAHSMEHGEEATGSALTLQSLYQVIVECADEAAQRALFERLSEEGHRCRALVL